MTDPLPGKEPVPLAPPSQPITGDSHHHLIAPLIAHAAELGYTRRDPRPPRATGPAAGATPSASEIVVATGPANRQVRTLVHELAHAHGLGYAAVRPRARPRSSSTASPTACCGSVGLDVGGESIPYVAGWGEDGALDAIREYAQTIDTIARRIEDALDADSPSRPPTPSRPKRSPREPTPARSGAASPR